MAISFRQYLMELTILVVLLISIVIAFVGFSRSWMSLSSVKALLMAKKSDPWFMVPAFAILIEVVLILVTSIFGNGYFFIWIISILLMPLALYSLLLFPKCVPGAVGSLIGWFFFFRDCGYFLNAGGSETPLCKSICATFGIHGSATEIWIPQLFLVLIGSVVGFLCPFIYRYLKKRSN